MKHLVDILSDVSCKCHSKLQLSKKNPWKSMLLSLRVFSRVYLRACGFTLWFSFQWLSLSKWPGFLKAWQRTFMVLQISPWLLSANLVLQFAIATASVNIFFVTQAVLDGKIKLYLTKYPSQKNCYSQLRPYLLERVLSVSSVGAWIFYDRWKTFVIRDSFTS